VFEPGDQIDIWVVEKALGSGGMGSVYRCHNRNATRILAAVKIMEGAQHQKSQAHARFIREAEILFSLQHPNIVKVLNIRSESHPPYIEMEFVEGESLESRIERGGMATEEAISILIPLAHAIGYLHACGIRHRDIKPANVLINARGLPKLVDFGLAMEADQSRITQSNMSFGTVSYAPPEWSKPELLDPVLWDLYSFGVLAYELLSGDLAFPIAKGSSARQSAIQIMVSKQSHPPLEPDESHPPELRALVRELTDPDPNNRPTSALDVLTRLIALAPDPSTLDARYSPQSLLQQQSAPTSIPDDPTDPSKPSTRTSADTFYLEGVEESPLTTASTRPSKRHRVFPWMVGALVLVMIGVGVLIASPWLRAQFAGVPKPRDVLVEITGLSQDTDVDLSIQQRFANASEGHTFTFDKLDIGVSELSWVIGADCAIQTCPGEDCPTWCVFGSTELSIEKGESPLLHTLPLTMPPPRTVAFVTPNVAKDTRVTFLLQHDELVVTASSESARITIQPGPYSLTSSTGNCPDDLTTCAASGSCPEDCAIATQFVEVGVGEPVLEVTVAIQAPTKPPKTLKKKFLKPDDARQRPDKKHRAARRPVTQREFSKWLSQNPKWQRRAAIETGLADANYLKNWTETGPRQNAQNKPIVYVSWYAANAYCQSHAGLADISANPTTWSEANRHAFEWRSKEGQAALLESTGVASRFKRTQCNLFTTFRCKR